MIALVRRGFMKLKELIIVFLVFFLVLPAVRKGNVLVVKIRKIGMKIVIVWMNFMKIQSKIVKNVYILANYVNLVVSV